MITVFYDGQCGLCSKEIHYYQRIAPSKTFDWQEISQSQKELTRQNISTVEALKLLHAKDGNGTLHIGVDAFIIIWKQLKYWKILARIICLPGIRELTGLVYKAFANWRFKRLEHCQLAARKEKV